MMIYSLVWVYVYIYIYTYIKEYMGTKNMMVVLIVTSSCRGGGGLWLQRFHKVLVEKKKIC